ncbi:unnamed protein product [Macrosiphum euphorbiae]|uniref:Uncharacterized protein n=1 Tax=Macrosiphum euphorbiae TaxID=13131 RepID=A0AAV0W0E4_9HEMI|nr:unnamed protein product [Macrosiphum euphorbiae]
MDEQIIKDVMSSYQIEPDNDSDELDDYFGPVPSISNDRAASRILEKFYYTKYEGTEYERKALFLINFD